MSDTTPISQEELIEIFGASMPMEAVMLLFGSPPEMTIGEVRATLREIARAQRKTGNADMSDEEKWERRFLNAVVIITERDEKIEQLQREYIQLEAQWKAAKALVVEQGNHRIMRERAEKEVERLTRERDEERSNHRRTVEAMEFEQRDTEAALGREGEGERDFDFRAHLQRQRDWSGKTFGPGPRTKGVIDHIRKELGEIEADPSDIAEWIDVVILALDGAWRAGHSPDQIIAALTAKQAKNEARDWPDWRTMPEDQAIEHVRTGETRLAALGREREAG